MHGDDELSDKPSKTVSPTFYCLNVREPQISDKLTSIAKSAKYLFWNVVEDDAECESFYVTSAFDDETDMFDIFYQASDNDEYYSPTCCFLSNDNVNTPIGLYFDSLHTKGAQDEEDCRIKIFKEKIFGFINNGEFVKARKQLKKVMCWCNLQV